MATLSEAGRLGPCQALIPKRPPMSPPPSSGPTCCCLEAVMGSRLSGEPAHRARRPRSLPDGRAGGRGLFPCSICSVKFVKCKESLNSVSLKEKILFNPFVF